MITFKKTFEHVAEIWLGSVKIGHMSDLRHVYELSVCYHDFTIKRSQRSAIKQTIKFNFRFRKTNQSWQFYHH